MRRSLDVFSAVFVCFFIAASALYSPLIPPNPGPLYEGVKLVLSNQKFKAELVWNETVWHVSATSYRLQNSIDNLIQHSDDITAVLEHLSWLDHPVKLRRCLKQYEREIARFNREILQKYDDCMETLVVARDKLVNDTLVEIDFIRNAAERIRNVAIACNIAALRRHNYTNQAGVILCLGSRVGQIILQMDDSAQFCLDRVSYASFVAGVDSEDNSCRDFEDLKPQVEVLHSKVFECVNQK